MIGKPFASSQLAIASIATGTILRRITVTGTPNSLSATPDGKTIFISSDASIWSAPTAGGEPRKIRTGNGVAGVGPLGKYLLVQVYEHPKIRLIKFPLDGSTEREIPLNGPYRLAPYTPIGSGNISMDGLLLAPLASSDSFFVSPGVVNLATGHMMRIPVDPNFDYGFMARSSGGQITAVAAGLKSTLWRFQPIAAEGVPTGR